MTGELLFYDIEVYKYDSLVVFKDINNRKVRSFWNTRIPEGSTCEDMPNGFEDVRSLIKGNILVGYNNYYYDDKILTLMMKGLPQKYIKKNNDIIIRSGSDHIKTDPDIISLDTMQQIGLARPSLKRIEGNMGKSIVETSVDFSINRPLTDEEREEVERYCSYDVENTIEVYRLRKKSYFDTKAELLKMLNNESAARWNTTTISAQILMNKQQHQWTKLQVPAHLWKNQELGIDSDVWDMWEKANLDSMTKGLSQVKTMFDGKCEMTFGFGGLHGVATTGTTFKDVKLLDVGSMYPTIIIYLRALGDATDKYDQIRKERLAIKHVDKVKSDALKLVLNSVYGNLKNQYSLLYNPMASATVCIYGQIALFTLCKRLHEAGYTIVNANTDGVAFCGAGRGYEEIWHQWEKDFAPMVLELDRFKTWIQKDVNNYIATQGDHIKVKGGETNKYHEDRLFSNNNIRIVQIAMVNKLLKNEDPGETIIEHMNQPQLFQFILTAGHTYDGVYDESGNKYNNVNRVFACKPKYANPKLYKRRPDGGLVNFPDLPEHCMIWNGDVNDLTDFKDKIDIKYYTNLVNDKLKGWINT